MSFSSALGLALRKGLVHPLMKNQDPEHSCSIESRRSMIQSKPILKNIYEHWYQIVTNALPAIPGATLELGTGAGFLKKHIPELIRSDVSHLNDIDCVIDACQLPIRDNSLRAIILVDVFHHLSKPTEFLSEANRCLKPGGKIIMIEPWMTKWSRYIYTHMHQEAVDIEREDWSLPSSGPLSEANVALPWIVFERDQKKFEKQFPALNIDQINLMMPISYIVSGGITLRSLAPYWTRNFWLSLDKSLSRWHHHLAMFCSIVITKT